MCYYYSDYLREKINAKLTAREARLADFYMLQTHGFGRTTDKLSQKYIKAKTGFKADVIISTTKSLCEKLPEIFRASELDAETEGWQSDGFKIELVQGRPVFRADNITDHEAYKAQQQHIAELSARVDFLQSENKALRNENRERRLQYEALKGMADEVNERRYCIPTAANLSASGTNCSPTAQNGHIQSKNLPKKNTTTTPPAPTFDLSFEQKNPMPVAKQTVAIGGGRGGESSPSNSPDATGHTEDSQPELCIPTSVDKKLNTLQKQQVIDLAHKTDIPQLIIYTLAARLENPNLTPVANAHAFVSCLVKRYNTDPVMFDRSKGAAYAERVTAAKQVKTPTDEEKPKIDPEIIKHYYKQKAIIDNYRRAGESEESIKALGNYELFVKAREKYLAAKA